MIILIPSYKRTEILHWVIQSVIECDTTGIDERILLLIVNNFPPNRQKVDTIVTQFKFEKNFQCQIIHRERTLPAVESWFSALFSVANEDEVFYLLGDDDIMLPWGLKKRYFQITELHADMLLSDFYQRLYFFDNGQRCWYTGDKINPPRESLHAVTWEYLPANHPEASFISNHCYRNTTQFRKGFEKAITWCKAQDWVPIDYATGNLPFYMAYAIKSSGGKVVSLHEKSVIRGCMAEEAIFQDYSDGGNTAFYCLLIYNTFFNKSLHKDIREFHDLRVKYKHTFIKGFITILFNNNIPNKTLKQTLVMSNFHWGDFLVKDIFWNIFVIVKRLLGLRGFRLTRKQKSGKELLETIFFFNYFLVEK